MKKGSSRQPGLQTGTRRGLVGWERWNGWQQVVARVLCGLPKPQFPPCTTGLMNACEHRQAVSERAQLSAGTWSAPSATSPDMPGPSLKSFSWSMRSHQLGSKPRFLIWSLILPCTPCAHSCFRALCLLFPIPGMPSLTWLPPSSPIRAEAFSDSRSAWHSLPSCSPPWTLFHVPVASSGVCSYGSCLLVGLPPPL